MLKRWECVNPLYIVLWYNISARITYFWHNIHTFIKTIVININRCILVLRIVFTRFTDFLTTWKHNRNYQILLMRHNVFNCISPRHLLHTSLLLIFKQDFNTVFVRKKSIQQNLGTSFSPLQAKLHSFVIIMRHTYTLLLTFLLLFFEVV